MKRIACVTSVLMALAGGAAEKVWKAGVIDWPSDGWTNANYWDGGLPGSEDTAMFTCAVTVRVTKASCADVNTIRQVSAKWMYDFRLELDSTGGDFDFDCMLGGSVWAVKKGAGTVQLTSNRKAAQAYGCYTDFGCNRLIVQEGTLQLPKVATGYCLPVIEIAAGATFAHAAEANAIIGGLVGAGTFANTSGAARTIQIGSAGSTTSCEFAGKVENFYLAVYINQRFTGMENVALGGTYVDYGSAEAKTYGILGFAKLGNTDGTASSVGVGTYVDARRGGRLLYLGNGETSNKEIFYRTDSGLSPILDGGTDGGLVLTGNVHPYADVVANNKMGELVLDGANTNACVIAGYYNTKRTATDGTEVTIYTTKKGSGVWRFADAPSRTGTGGYGVLEGTLQFESIAETNVNCSLGRATRLAEGYYGDWDATKAVSYAYRLGDAASTNAVFEYVGSVANACSTRPIAMGGEAHLCANGVAGAPLDFAGVSVLTSGPETKTLILDGTNTDANVLGNVSDAGGRLTLVKDGSGTWTLDRQQTFCGDLIVKGGTLKVKKVSNFTWFKLTIKALNRTDKNRFFIAEFGLYSADGVRRNSNLTFLPGTITDGGVYTSGHKPTLLQENMFTYGDTSAQKYSYRIDAEYGLAALFDGALNNPWFARNNGTIPDGQGNNEYSIVMRLADDVPEITAFDFAQGNVDETAQTIAIYGAMDGSGENWTEFWSGTFETYRPGVWQSDGKAISTAGPREGIALTHPAVPASVAPVLENVASYSVTPGATLRFIGTEPPVIANLVIDGSTGAGTINGFRLGRDVTVDVMNAPKHGAVSRPVGFTGLSGFGDVTNWTYTINGAAPRNRTVKLTPDSLEIIPGGLSVILE